MIKKCDEVIYNGKKYLRFKKEWMDSTYCIVNDSLQRKLNIQWSRQENIEDMTFDELIKAGDKYKGSASDKLSEKYFQNALDLAEKNSNMNCIRIVLPRLTSIYRLEKQPQKAINLFEECIKKYSESVTSIPLLTSIAAAYCDIEQFDKARYFANRAFAHSGGNGSGELSAVYGRIKKETGEK